jgi:hypothetical protein
MLISNPTKYCKTFFAYTFVQFFQLFCNQRKILRFDAMSEVLLTLFSISEAKRGKNGSKYRKNILYKQI